MKTELDDSLSRRDIDDSPILCKRITRRTVVTVRSTLERTLTSGRLSAFPCLRVTVTNSRLGSVCTSVYRRVPERSSNGLVEVKQKFDYP